MPALGFLITMLSWSSGLFEMLGVGSHPMDQGAAALAVWCGFGLPGVVAAVISLVRSERLGGITAVALLLNGLLALGFIALGGFAGEYRNDLAPYAALVCAALVLFGIFWPQKDQGHSE